MIYFIISRVVTSQSCDTITICSVFYIQAKNVLFPRERSKENFPHALVPLPNAFRRRKYTIVLTCGNIFPTSS